MSEYFDEAGHLNQTGKFVLKRLQAGVSGPAPAEPAASSGSSATPAGTDELALFGNVLLDALEHDRGARALHAMDGVRIFGRFIQDFEAMRNCTQNDFHHKPVLAHTFEALDHLDDFIDNPAVLSEKYENRIIELLGSNAGEICVDDDDNDDTDSGRDRSPTVMCRASVAPYPITVKAALRLALLFHDIAKPSTKSVRPDGHVTFYEHDLYGAEAAARFSSSIPVLTGASNAVARLIRHHQLLGFLARDDKPNMKSVNRFIGKLGRLTPAALILCISDRMAARGPAVPQDNIDRHFEFAGVILDTYYNPPPEQPKPLLTGRDVMSILAVSEGPRVGRILAECEKRRRLGWLKDRESAILWLKNLNP